MADASGITDFSLKNKSNLPSVSGEQLAEARRRSLMVSKKKEFGYAK
jgi:hypothetical protein